LCFRKTVIPPLLHTPLVFLRNVCPPFYFLVNSIKEELRKRLIGEREIYQSTLYMANTLNSSRWSKLMDCGSANKSAKSNFIKTDEFWWLFFSPLSACEFAEWLERRSQVPKVFFFVCVSGTLRALCILRLYLWRLRGGPKNEASADGVLRSAGAVWHDERTAVCFSFLTMWKLPDTQWTFFLLRHHRNKANSFFGKRKTFRLEAPKMSSTLRDWWISIAISAAAQIDWNHHV
jgi:hypothetical protein